MNLFSKYGETVNTVRVSNSAVKNILEIVGWPSVPLIFVKVCYVYIALRYLQFMGTTRLFIDVIFDRLQLHVEYGYKKITWRNL